MSMLKSFFEIGADKSLFDGLAISKDTALFDEYLGKYPVIFISFKDVDGLRFDNARSNLINKIGTEAERFSFLLDSNHLSQNEKDKYSALISLEKGEYTMNETMLSSSLNLLSSLLYKHFNKKVIILIDEYDVPLDKAFKNGYYKEMVALIRSLFGQALKTNDSLFFAVLTGCLRVSKESIFTGLNNLKVLSITDTRFDEHFGFTEDEVRRMFSDYEIEDHLKEAKEWYDGYRFGEEDVYCPWDVINYVDRIASDPDAKPEAFWINSSGNDLVKRFIDKADASTRSEIERLISGDMIEKKVRLDSAYDELDSTIDNLWSVLFTTGYLTQKGMGEDGSYKLVIPNREEREVFIDQIEVWFKEKIRNEKKPMSELLCSFLSGDAEGVERRLNIILNQSISILDTKAKDGEKENFYHGLLVGLLKSEENWLVLSNRESGDGYADIIIEPDDLDKGMVIEVKYAQSFDDLDKRSEEALSQIRDKRYTERLYEDSRRDILLYGISFNRKRCKVKCEKR